MMLSTCAVCTAPFDDPKSQCWTDAMKAPWSSAGPPELVSSAGEGSSSGAAFTPGGSRSSDAVGSEFFWKGLRGGPELSMQVVLLCRPPGARGRVSRSSRDTRAWVRFGQKPKTVPSVLTLSMTYACGEGRVAGQHSSQVEKYGWSKASVRVFSSQAFGATPTQGVLLCMWARHAVELLCAEA